MKRFGINGFIFFLLCSTLYMGSMLLLNSVKLGGTPIAFRFIDGVTWYGGDTYQRFKDYSTSPDNDLVIIGSSHAYRGYDPRIFEANGITAFNLGSHSQSIADTEILIEEVLDKEQTRLLIYEVYPMLFEGDGFESSSFLIANCPSDKAALKMACNLSDIRTVNMLALRVGNKFIEPYAPLEGYTYRGYCSNTDSVGISDKSKSEKHFKFKKEHAASLKKLIEYCHENAVNLLLVTHPQPLTASALQFKEFNEFIAGMLEGTGFEHLDYSRNESFSPRDHFYDSHHLNQSGVDLFNSLLIQKLKQKHLTSRP